MFKLNRDVLYLIFKELQNDKKTLLSCLIVNKTWCETTIPILWRDPWKYLEGKKLLLNVIISHLSDESRDNLKSQGIDFLTNPYQRPLFNYISFCRHLNLNNLNEMLNTIKHLDEFSIINVKKEIINLFVNENTRLSHLYIPHQFDYDQIHLIPG